MTRRDREDRRGERPAEAERAAGERGRAADTPAAAILRLQQSAGNQAVQRYLRAGGAGGSLVQRQGPAPAPGVTPPQPGPPGSPTAERKLDFLKMKRKHIHLTGDDKYGHWWTEMDGSESYGWWPKRPVGLVDTLFGTEGELNGQTSFGGTPTKDPHHGDTAEDEFSPVLKGTKSDDDVRREVRAFATSYSGEWRWTFGWGQNCHTFQEAMMRKVGLRQ